MPRLLTVVVATITLSACASSGTQAPAAAPAPSGSASSASTTPPKSAGASPAAMASVAKPAALNPVGNYEFATEVNGSPMKGSLVINGSTGAYGGKMTSDIMPELPITSVVVDGQLVKMLADTPNGTVTIMLTFTGDTFTGNWELGGQGGNLSGKRITK